MGNQLSLFPEEVKQPEPEVNYWKKFYNWEPMIGQLARIDSVIDFCVTYQENRYCTGMWVKILSINEGKAQCETIKEWEEACNKANSLSDYNKAGTIWQINVNALAPILHKLK